MQSQGWNEMGGGGEISSSSSSHRRNNARVIRYCDCGVESPLVRSWTAGNNGRRFYGCGLYKLHGRRVCRYFDWLDEEINGDEKKVIAGLQRKFEEMKKKERIMEIALAISTVLVFVLVIAYIMK